MYWPLMFALTCLPSAFSLSLYIILPATPDGFLNEEETAGMTFYYKDAYTLCITQPCSKGDSEYSVLQNTLEAFTVFRFVIKFESGN